MDCGCVSFKRGKYTQVWLVIVPERCREGGGGRQSSLQENNPQCCNINVPQWSDDQHCPDSLTALTIKRFSCSWFLHCVIFLNIKKKIKLIIYKSISTIIAWLVCDIWHKHHKLSDILKFETIFKYHLWYLCQISHTNHAIICLYFYPQKFCNFHMYTM